MRSLPASHLKSSKRRGPPMHDVPREGSKLRETFDMFQASKGVPVIFSSVARDGRRIADLCDYYGLDIRNIGYGRWVLAGEWFGKVYVDYIAEHINRSEPERAT